MAASIFTRLQAPPRASQLGVLFRLEGLAVLSVALAWYGSYGFGWWWFALFLLAPDLSALGFLWNARVGCLSYNLAHTLVFPLALGVVAGFCGQGLGLQIALIWLAHIGMDRALGCGLRDAASLESKVR